MKVAPSLCSAPVGPRRKGKTLFALVFESVPNTWRRAALTAVCMFALASGCTHDVSPEDKGCAVSSDCAVLQHYSCVNPLCHCGTAVDAVSLSELERYQRAEMMAHCPVATPTMCQCRPDPWVAECENGTCVLREAATPTG